MGLSIVASVYLHGIEHEGSAVLRLSGVVRKVGNDL